MEGIPVSEYRERVRKVQELARKKRFDAVLAYSGKRYSMGQGVEDGQNLRYLVGFNFPPHEIQEKDVIVPYQSSESLLIIPTEDEPSLIISKAETERTKKQTWLQDVRTTTDQFANARYEGMAHITKDVLGAKRKVKLGLAGTNLPMNLYLELTKVLSRTKLVSCTNDLDMLRVVKSPNELRIMRKAAEIADEGVRALIETSRPGVAEYEVHMAVEKAMFDAGGDNPWSIVLSGPRSAIPYLSPDYTQRKLREGDMVYADIGTELMGYHSDIQPAYVVGRGTKDQLDLIETSVKMIKAMFNATRSRATDTEVLRAAYKTLDGNPFRDHVRTWTFGHGYGVGVDPPDMTGAMLTLPKSRQMKLQENMVLCYEPGIFVPGVGGAAVEDEVIVTSDGCEVISKCAERAQELLEQQRSQ
jgi:Xaa-Pro aminopeptidase